MTKLTDDYKNITLNNYTGISNENIKITLNNYTDILNDFDNITLSNFTYKENKIDIIIQTLFLLTKPCGLSFLCLMSLMVYTLIKPLFNKK